MLAQTAFLLGAGEGQVKTLQTRIKALEAVTKQTRSAELTALAKDLQYEKIQTISYVRLMRQAVAQNIAR
ncbi:MAG: hypothetical protein HYU05_01405 [Candidatus Wildermuthbacteria bacterium]|nr:hypothetical protein [Candidatus Wildermuthbacteria bacterium]MBI2121336.1 hypothetical protein [Candidatus Wildermuthbacteria bacterium]MBI2647884.1 hypothetical protein [Candidatus Wildermuthbacteria bacterium]